MIHRSSTGANGKVGGLGSVRPGSTAPGSLIICAAAGPTANSDSEYPSAAADNKYRKRSMGGPVRHRRWRNRPQISATEIALRSLRARRRTAPIMPNVSRESIRERV